MPRPHPRSAPTAVVALLVAALVAVACSDPSPDAAPATTAPVVETSTTTAPPGVTATATSTSTTVGRGTTTTTRPPVRGGTLTVGMPTAPASLDPVAVAGDGDAGGTELLAIYDSLVRFDPETGTYVPRLASSVVPNTDATVWTITVRAGVRFTDGTPFDAAAVKFGLDRHRAGAPDAPACETVRACPGLTSPELASMAFVREVTVVDERTLTVSLTVPWTDFPWLLATEVGMIPSPTALLATCPAEATAAARDCPFAAAPVGAGPFAVTSWAPGGPLLLRRNEGYWGGSPPLDGLRFTVSADRGGTRALDALLTGGVDAVFLRDAAAVRAAGDKRLPARAVLQEAGSAEVLNLGRPVTCRSGAPAPTCTGRPDGPADPLPATRFLRVRLAIAAAIDPGVVAERVTGARTDHDGDLLGRTTELWPRVESRAYEPDLARRLVTEAKANGWDGKVRYLCDSSPAGQARGIAIETMLKAAGIDPVVDTTHDAAHVLAALRTTRDFDVACSGFTNTVDAATDAVDGSTLASLTEQLASTGPENRSGWRNDRVDAALVALRAARTEAERRAATKVIVEQLRADAPVVVTGTRTEQLTWTARVHGIAASAGSRALFDRAFLTAGA